MTTLEILIDRGLIARRPEQIKFSLSVLSALQNARIAVKESPTGTGKTLGYTAAAVDFLRKNPSSRVVVSTHSKQLQNQIEQEIENRIRQIYTGDAFRCMVVKGKSNYLLRSEVLKELEKAKKQNHKGKTEVLEQLLDEADKVHGDIEQISESTQKALVEHYADGIEKFKTPRSQPIKETDYALQVRRLAEQANFIIVNHSLLVAYCLLLKSRNNSQAVNPIFGVTDFAREAETMPEDRKVSVIIDEAHKFERMAMLFLTKETALRDLTLVGQAIIESEDPKKLPKTYKEEFEKIKSAVDSIIKASQEENRRYILVSPKTVQHIPTLKLLDRHIESFRDYMDRTLCIAKNSPSVAVSTKERAERIHAAITRVHDQLKSKNQKGNADKCFIITFSDERRYPSISIVPVGIGGVLFSVLYNFRAIVLTGGTLQDPPKRGNVPVSQRFNSISNILGLTTLLKKRTQTEVDADIYKGFDLTEMATVHVYPDAPETPTANEDESFNYPERLAKEYIYPMAGLIRGIVAKSKKCLILTNAHYETKIYSEVLSGRVDKEVLTFDSDTKASFLQVVDKFNGAENAVLITASGWEGVDTKIDTLLISRIPVPPPDDPFYIAMQEALIDYYSTRATGTQDAERKSRATVESRKRFDTFVKFRQGLGRAIRSEEDRCSIHILDKRAMHRYGDFLKSNYKVVESTVNLQQ